MSEPELDSVAKSASIRFDCPKCGGQRIFDAEKGVLRCEACGFSEAIENSAAKSIVEYDLERGLTDTPQRGLGLEMKASSCQSCGAIISFGTNETATACSFCGSSNVLELDSHRQTLRPESLIPFQRTKADAQQFFQSWIKSLWFRPNDLKRLAKVSLLQGVYIPYWVFDATIDSDWSAMAGYHYYVTEHYTTTVNGQTQTQTRQVQKTRWVPASGSRHDVYDDFSRLCIEGTPLQTRRSFRQFRYEKSEAL